MSDIDKCDAYCKNCGYLDGSRVTFYETCDDCHIPVEWHSSDDQTKIEKLEKLYNYCELKFKSGNETAVSQITITRSEWDELIKSQEVKK